MLNTLGEDNIDDLGLGLLLKIVIGIGLLLIQMFADCLHILVALQCSKPYLGLLIKVLCAILLESLFKLITYHMLKLLELIGDPLSFLKDSTCSAM